MPWQPGGILLSQLECPVFYRFSTEQAHHMPVSIAANTFVPSIEGGVAAASKDSAPNASLFKAGRVSLTVPASITLYLITSQIFSSRLAAVQSFVNKPSTFQTTKRIFLGQIGKPYFSGELQNRIAGIYPVIPSSSRPR